MLPRAAILISGRGSNMEAILNSRSQIPAEFSLVLSDKAGAEGLEVARKAGISVAVIERGKGEPKATHEFQMIEVLKDAGVTHIVLAGFMRILSKNFLDHFVATLNIHPSLLPSLPGLNTHARALKSNLSVHGCTVHLVDSGIDTGPILAQAGLSVRPNETPDSLAAKVLKLEHSLYPVTISNFLRGRSQNQVLATDHPTG